MEMSTDTVVVLVSVHHVNLGEDMEMSTYNAILFVHNVNLGENRER